MILQWLAAPEWARLVEALLHTLWQGAILAVGLGLMLRRVHEPVWRYRFSLVALGAVMLSGLITWAVLMHPAASPGSAAPAADTAAVIAPTPSSDQPTLIVQAAALAPQAARTNWTAWLAFVWLLGAAVMLGRAGVQVAGAERLRRTCRPVADARIQSLFQEAQRALKLARRVRLAVTDQLTSPAVAGVLVPTLILPLSLTTMLTPEQIRMVLLHELAHIRRGDYLANLFQLFAESLLFFNPAVWWISRQLRVEREACCDATAIGFSGAPAEYAQTLLTVAESVLQPPPAAAPAFGWSRPPSTLRERVQRMLIPGYRPALRLTWRAMILAMLTGGGLLFLCAIGTRTAVAAIMSPQERIARIEQKMAEIGEHPNAPAFTGFTEQSPRVTLTGRVHAADGTPLPKRLYLNTDSSVSHSGYGTSIPIRNGAFSDSIPAGTIWVHLEPDNFAPAFLGPLDGLATNRLDNLDLVLERGYDVPVQFVDVETGAPVPGVRFSSYYMISNMGTASQSWTAGADGLAKLTHCANLPLNLTINAPGYEITQRHFETLPAGQSLKISLHRGVEMSGTVVDESGHPIPGAAVCMIYQKGEVSSQRFDWNDSLHQLAVADQNGRFTVNQLNAKNLFWLGVSAPGHRSVILNPMRAGTADMVIRLGPELVVRGRVIGSLAGLQQINKDRCLYYTSNDVFDNNSYGNNGWIPVKLVDGVARFQFTNRVVGEIAIDVGTRTSIRREINAPVDDWVIDLTSNSAAASPPVVKRTVIYRFQHPSGVAPQGTVEAEIPDSLEPGHMTAHMAELVITNGEVRAEIPIGGRITIKPKRTIGYWFKDDFMGTMVTNGTGQLVKEIPVVPAGAIYVRVKNADGSQAGGMLFSVEELKRSPQRDASSPLTDNMDNVSGDAPRPWVSGPLPLDGKYQIIAWRKNEFCASAPVRLTESQPDAEVTMQFSPTQNITGEVTDATGQPVRGSAVGVEFRIGTQSFGLTGVTTDDQGRFVVAGITPGLGIYSVNVSEPGWRAEIKDVNLSRLPVKIQLEPGHRIAGQIVEAATGNVIPNAEVRAFMYGGGNQWPAQTTHTDATGHFEFNTLADTIYRIYVNGANYDKNFDRRFKAGETNVLLKVTPYPGSELKPKAPVAAAEGPSGAPTEANQLEVRTFRVDPEFLLAGLQRLGTNVDGMGSHIPELCVGWFATLGVNWQYPKITFYNDGAGLLVVRATQADLDAIERAIIHLHANDPNRTYSAPRPKPAARNPVQMGKLFYEQGRLTEAAEELNTALAEDPSNAAALYYSKLVAQSQRLVTSPTNWVAPQWRNTPTNAPANPDRLVVRTFKVDSRAILYALRRVGTNVTSVSSNTNLSQHCRGLFANFGLKLEFPKSVFYNDRLSLLVVRATEADLDVVGQLLSAADRVAPNHAPANPNRLVLRAYKVDAQAILDSLRRAGTNVDGVKFYNPTFAELCRGWFAAAGVKLESSKSISFNDDRGLLYVQATSADLAVIDQLLPVAASLPPQIHLKARFLELPADALAGVTFYQTNVSGQITGFLTDSQMRALLKRWQKLAGAEWLAEPEVVTTSGRQTRMKATQVRSIITEFSHATLTPPGVTGADATNYLETETVEVGPQLEVAPYVLADNFTINLSMTASLKEFLGYDDHGRSSEVTVDPNGKRSNTGTPSPLTRQRQMGALVNLYDNQSVILAHLPATTEQPADEYFAWQQKILPPAKADKKQLVVIVTATLVDPDGNRLHEDDEMPFAQKGPPPQPGK